MNGALRESDFQCSIDENYHKKVEPYEIAAASLFR